MTPGYLTIWPQNRGGLPVDLYIQELALFRMGGGSAVPGPLWTDVSHYVGVSRHVTFLQPFIFQTNNLTSVALAKMVPMQNSNLNLSLEN